MNEKIHGRKGITLIALVITIVVLLILAGVTVLTLTGQNGLLTKASIATKENKVGEKKEEVALAIETALINHNGNRTEVTIDEVVNEVRKKYKQNEKSAIEGEPTGESETKFPADIIFNKPASGLNDAIMVSVNGNLEITGAEIVEPDPYTTYEPLEPVNSENVIFGSDYKKFGNVYYNTPDLSGFNPKYTYYVTYDSSGNPVIQGRIDRVEAPRNWHDYENKKWANVVTVTDGNITYWTWIPRYKYKVENNAVTAKFISKNDTYKNENDADETLGTEYQKPDSFKFSETDLYGYWISKYRIQEGSSNNPIKLTYGKNKVKVEKTDEDPNNNHKYIVFVEGAVYDEGREQTLPINIKTTSTNLFVVLQDTTTKAVYAGNNVIAPSTGNISVDLSGFEPSVTKYVTYENGVETIGENIKLDSNGKATNMPKGWFDYANKKWANIVTSNNGNTTYWTYIPRYEYKFWPVTNVLKAKFITTSTTEETNEYKIPDSFKFAGQNIPGYWISKYRIQEGTDNNTTEIVSSTNKIQVDLSGFEPSVTKYVTYDNTGKETIGNNIQLDSNGNATNMPANWYDYNNKRWANIVTENGGKKSYWTYIPRYKYSIWPSSGVITARFIDITETPETIVQNSNGYKIPDSFRFAGQDLKGYWISKYRIQE